MTCWVWYAFGMFPELHKAARNIRPANLPPTTFTMDGETFEVKPGDVIEKVGGIAERLRPGDDFSDSSYPGCQFRLPTNSKPIESVAVNVRVTGRSWQVRNGALWVKARIEYVGDGEPSTFGSAWLMNPRDTQHSDSWYAKNPVKPFA